MGRCWNWAMVVQESAVLFKLSNGLTCPWYFHCLIINERKTARESPPVDHLPLNKAAHVSVSTFLALSLLLSLCNLILTQLYYYSVSLWVTFPLIGIWLFSVSLLILFQWTCLKRTHFLLRLCVIHASHFCNVWLASSGGGEREPGIFALCIHLLEFPCRIVKTQTRWQERWATCPICQKCAEEAGLTWVYSKAVGLEWREVLSEYWKQFSINIFFSICECILLQLGLRPFCVCFLVCASKRRWLARIFLPFYPSCWQVYLSWKSDSNVPFQSKVRNPPHDLPIQ